MVLNGQANHEVIDVKEVPPLTTPVETKNNSNDYVQILKLFLNGKKKKNNNNNIVSLFQLGNIRKQDLKCLEKWFTGAVSGLIPKI